MSTWPEVTTAKSENRHEIKLAGASISKRITDSGLDKNLFRLTNLNLLNISDTCLTLIPDDIKLLTNLQSLLLFGNQIKEFNENITSLSKLKVLDLSRNQISSIPESLQNMKELTSINFSSNSIESMPKFVDFPNLISVDLSNNKLKEFLDVENSNLPHLTDLKINGNAVESLPNDIATSLPSLKNFDIGENQLKIVPGEVANMSKLKELNLKGNKLSDKRLMKLVDQCRTKQVLDYVREHCPKASQSQPTAAKSKAKKNAKKQDPSPPENNIDNLTHSMKILYLEDEVPKVKIIESEVNNVRPYILCCIVKDLHMDQALFKKFIKLQTKLHDTVCDKRNVATIATHDLSKVAPGDLTYAARAPAALMLTPLSRFRPYSGEELFQQLTAEADALRKEKKRNVYSGIHKYLYLLEGKPKYPYLEDASGTVISFPPITNSEVTKMSFETKNMLVEVTSQASLGSCKVAMNKFLHECLLLGIGDNPEEPSSYHSLNIQQMKVVDLEGNLKSVYPSRTDCVYENVNDVTVYRLQKN